MSIKSRIKGFYNSKREILVPTFVLILLLFISFGVGYLSAIEFNPAPIVIEKCD